MYNIKYDKTAAADNRVVGVITNSYIIIYVEKYYTL